MELYWISEATRELKSTDVELRVKKLKKFSFRPFFSSTKFHAARVDGSVRNHRNCHCKGRLGFNFLFTAIKFKFVTSSHRQL